MKFKLKKYEKGLLIFTMIDILFAPYVFFIATTYSQFFVFIWFLRKDKRFFNRREVRFYYGIFGLILFSTLVSLLVLPQNGDIVYYAVENFKIGLNIGLGISYYFFFFYMFKFTKVIIEKWLIAFVLFVTLWGVLYYLNLDMFLVFKQIFNPRDSFLAFSLDKFYFLRFNYIWTDPNNIGYALVGVVAFLIINKGVTNMQLIVVILSLLFNLFIIMSTGAIVAAVLLIPAAYIIRLIESRKLLNYAVLVVSTVMMIFIVKEVYTTFAQSEIGEQSIARQEEKSNSGDSRTRIWGKLIKSKNILYYFFTGEGSVIFVDGKPYAPHNGHLVFIYGYGLVCYFFYMYIVFRKSRNQKWIDYLYILPFLLCFTVNIGIGELKYAAIMYMMIAYSRVGKYINT